MQNSSRLISDIGCPSLVKFLKGCYALQYFELVEPHDPLPSLFAFFLTSFVLLPPRDNDNQRFLWFNLP